MGMDPTDEGYILKIIDLMRGPVGTLKQGFKPVSQELSEVAKPIISWRNTQILPQTGL